MNVMGLDLSLNGTGVSIYDGKLWATMIKTSKLKSHMDKVIRIKRIIFSKIKKYNIGKVFIEGQSFGSRGQATLSIAQLHGVMMYFLIKKKVPFVLIPPSQVKKYITGRGNCKKSLILKCLYKYYGIDIDQEDMADSFAIMITGLKIARVKKNG